jgi:hypothetical protein
VDDRRTHEVRAAVRGGSSRAFVVRERALDSQDPSETFEVTHVLHEPWEWRMHQLALEARLSLLGRYQRAVVGQPGWSPIAAPPPGKGLDLVPLAVDDESVRLQFHHYAQHGAQHTVTIVGVPLEHERFSLARLDYAFPDVNGGNLLILHPKLPLPVYRSVLAAQHLELIELGMRKIGGREDGPMSSDPRWWAAMQACLDALLSRLVEGRIGKPGDPRQQGLDGVAGVIGRLEAAALKKKLRTVATRGRAFETEDEIGLANASAAEGKKPEAMIDDLPADVTAPLRDPRLHAIVGRFLAPDDQARVVDEGERAIKDAMKRVRARTRPEQQHLLSLVEASLLVRSAMKRRGAKLDMDTLNTLRHAPAYF